MLPAELVDTTYMKCFIIINVFSFVFSFPLSFLLLASWWVSRYALSRFYRWPSSGTRWKYICCVVNSRSNNEERYSRSLERYDISRWTRKKKYPETRRKRHKSPIKYYSLENINGKYFTSRNIAFKNAFSLFFFFKAHLFFLLVENRRPLLTYVLGPCCLFRGKTFKCLWLLLHATFLVFIFFLFKYVYIYY